MFRVHKKPRFWFWLLPLAVGTGWLSVLHFAPWYFVAALDNIEIKEEEDERSADILEERVISSGKGALPYLIPRLEGSRGFQHPLLFGALRGIGPPAHDELLNRVAATKGTAACTGYVYALQEAFGDFSQANCWIDQASRHPTGVAFLQGQLLKRYGGSMPTILNEDRKVSSDFEAWWAKHRVR